MTGGRGGLGQAITKAALDEGHIVVSIDRVVSEKPAGPAELHQIVANTSDYDALLAAFTGCDALIHMAAIPHPLGAPNHVVHNSNVVGSYNAMRAAIECGIVRICQASSVNAIGQGYSRVPRYDYFPVDESHETYCEDPYALSKWICEQQAASLARMFGAVSIASMRFPWVLKDRATAIRHYKDLDWSPDRHLWSYVRPDAAAKACLLAVQANLNGHEVFYVAAADTASERPSGINAALHFPNVPLRNPLPSNTSFLDSAKARRHLNWAGSED